MVKYGDNPKVFDVSDALNNQDLDGRIQVKYKLFDCFTIGEVFSIGAFIEKLKTVVMEEYVSEHQDPSSLPSRFCFHGQ